jgi:hypothetical protein
MTTLSILSPPLRRLFSLLDSAPKPRSVGLGRLLEHWRDKRGARVMPRLEDIDKTEIGDATALMFIYRSSRDHAYTLVAGRQAVSSLLGASQVGDSLAQAEDRRAAARCRRLFDCALEAGEPVLGEYRMKRGQKWSNVEILAAPLADGEPSGKAVFGGVAIHPM